MSEIMGIYSRDPNDDAPTNDSIIVDPATPAIPVMINLEVVQGQLVFKMKDMRNVSEKDSVIGESDDDGYYIRVRDDDLVIEFELSAEWDWGFDGLKPFTLKKKKNGPHDNSKNFHCRDHDPANPRKLFVEMKPSGQHPGNHGFKQGYNLYVAMGQPKGEPLPIRIDPIVKNPPPGDGKNAKAGVWVPI
jgi:hypothetical protein